MPNVGMSASYTWRHMGNTNWRPIICSSCTSGYIDGSAYTYKGNVIGTMAAGSYSVPYYGLSSGVVYDPAKGTIYTARPDYHQIYQGVEVTATKRMSNRWMARLGFSANSWNEYFDSTLGQGNPTPVLGSPNVSGGPVLVASTGSGKSGVYMSQPKYQFIANGAYQLPYEIDLGLSYLLRQGYALPYYYSASGGFTDTLGSTKKLLLENPVNSYLLPAVQSVDFRIGKRIKFGHGTSLSIDLDVFNIFNSNTTLQTQLSNTAANFGTTLEVMQPRIARIGARFSF